MLRKITVAFAFFVLELWPFDCVCMLILCNLPSFRLHNSLTVRDIFMQFYKNIYQVETMCRLQE